MESLIPPQAKWVKEAVTEFRPEENVVVTKEGRKIGYEYLVVAMGLQVNYDKARELGLKRQCKCSLSFLCVIPVCGAVSPPN